MLNNWQSFILVTLSVVGSLIFMRVLNWVWPREKRREHNEQIGWQLTALGTTYAVILGFMMFAVWTDFGAAELNANLEADALVNLYRLAAGLPAPQRDALRNLARGYADAAIQQEWPQMEDGRVPEETRSLDGSMWNTIMSIQAASGTELAAEDHAITQLGALTQYRRTRILQSTSTLPDVLWCVLITGGILTVASACLFGSGNSVLHALQVFAFSLLISLGLVAIGDINRPFQGSVHVSTFAFVRAQVNMQAP